jgi:glycosyltransferase involved in cell wall biosynthesis
MQTSPGRQNFSRETETVSVIIPCFNHARFLSRAIESVLSQTYRPVEIVVVDDGSSDNTKEVAERFKGVKYVHQNNQGLAAARNTGIAASTGAYLLFLDADDWLLPEGIETNVSYFQADKKIGFVSGNYLSHYEKDGGEKIMEREIKQDPYADLLLYNHIKMHASVLFPRWVFETYQYDSSLRASEDWDLYLHIARHHPIVQHHKPIAVYRRYGTSLSRNNVVMLKTGLRVLEKQAPHVRTSLEKANLAKGREYVVRKFTRRIYHHLLRTQKGDPGQLALLFQYNKHLYVKWQLRKLVTLFLPKKTKTSFSI